MLKLGRKSRSRHPVTPDWGREHACSSTVCIDDVPVSPRRIMLLTDDDRQPELSTIRKRVAVVAASHSASVLLYDLAVATGWTDPYLHFAGSYPYVGIPDPHIAGAEWNRSLGKDNVRALGRAYLARQLQELEQHGVPATVVIPDRHGLSHLASCAKQERVDLIVIPAKFAHPTLWDRLRGYSVKRLVQHTDIPVAVYEADGSAWLANESGTTAGPHDAPRAPGGSDRGEADHDWLEESGVDWCAFHW